MLAISMRRVRSLSAALVLLCWAGVVGAQVSGIVTHLSGTLSVKKSDGSGKLLSVKSEFAEGDVLSTQDATYARLKFSDGAEIVLRPNSQLAIQQYRFVDADPQGDGSMLSLLRGGLRAVTGLLGKRNPARVGVTTPTSTIGIRGTHFGLLLCQNDCGDIPSIGGRPAENGLHIDVADGAIHVANPAGQQVISAGQFGFVASINVPPIIVPPSQGIQVTMPPSISQNSNAGKTIGQKAEEPECTVK